MSQILDSLDDARAAAARQAWRSAYSAYVGADAGALTASDLENFGEAAWWSGKIDEAIRHREKAFAAYTSDGDDRGAARLALTLAWDYEGKGSFAVSSGWFASAERLLTDVDEAPEHGFLLLTKALGAMMQGELEAAVAMFEEAYELAKRVGDRDGQMLALSGKGRTLISAGEIDKGLALLDEASASALCGDISAHSAGLVYCITISSCQDVGDYRRAAEWTEAANRWCDTLDVTGFPGACRVHRAEAMRLRGDWSAAEAQALAACEELKDFDQMIPAAGWYEIGEIRRRRGDLAGAEEAYRISSELGREPQPGLSLVRLAEGKVDAAVGRGQAIARGGTGSRLFRLRRLPAQVEIAIAAGDLRTARAAADEMEQTVDAYKIGDRRAAAFDAMVHFSRGQILLAEKDWDGAIDALKHARDEWQGIGAPYETARVRAALGNAYRRAGDEHGSTVELEGALATFERLGAVPEAARIKEQLGRVETRRTFLFTDIVDSTRLLDTLGDDKWKRLLARHNELVRDAIAEHGGEVVKQTGDGFFASFENPKAAIEAAVAIQRALAAEIVAPDVRIGAHAGGAFRTEESTDYGGQGVHVASRIGAAAAAGEILVSVETLDGVGGAFRALGGARGESQGRRAAGRHRRDRLALMR